MDGISSASAVVSLATQLIVTTRDVTNFLREIQDSPEELRCTIESLDLLRGNFEEVKRLVEEQIACVDLPSSIGSISDALAFCESKIKSVEQLVNKFKGVLSGRSFVRKKWESLKHVLGKREIKRLQYQLKLATETLQLALVTNMNRLQVQNIQFAASLLKKFSIMSNNEQPSARKISIAISHVNEEVILGSSSDIANLTNVTHVHPAIILNSAQRRRTPRATTNLKGKSRNRKEKSSLTQNTVLPSKDQEPKMFSPASPPQSRVISRERMLLWYAGLFGNLSLQTKSKYIDDNPNVHAVDKRAVSEERIFIFRPSFLKNNQFELRVINRCGHIARTLSMDCVVDFKAPVFDMCRSGDIRGLRDAYYSGSISLNVVNPLGMGLLHYAAGSFQKDLCSWLLGMGVGADRTSRLGNTALTYMGTRSKIDQTSAVTKTMTEIARLLIQAQRDFSEFDMSEWFLEYDGPPEGVELILSEDLAKYYIRFADASDPFYPALASILRLYAKNPEPWESVIRLLLRCGANVHARVRRDLTDLDQSEYLGDLDQYGTPLDELFIYTMDPFEGQKAANGWLQILASEGHNISAYLQKESTLHQAPMQLTHPSYRTIGYESERKLVFEWGAHPTVSWDWWISPSSSTFRLREEFRIMAMTRPDCMLINKPWKEAWPLRFPAWSELHQYCGDKTSRSHHKKLLECADARAVKRFKEKARKMAHLGRIEGPSKVPGAWPIEYDI